jgi:hypothetical protein
MDGGIGLEVGIYPGTFNFMISTGLLPALARAPKFDLK